MSEERTCHVCGTRTAEFCPVCLAAYDQLPDPETMSEEERRQEMDLIAGPLEIPFSKLHARIEALVGRGVFTHEMTTANWPRLVNEAVNRRPPRPEAILNLIPEEKRMVVVVPREEAPP